jgi:hypothetical protein
VKLTRAQLVAIIAGPSCLVFVLLSHAYGRSVFRFEIVPELIASLVVVAISVAGATRAANTTELGDVFRVLIVILFGVCGVLSQFLGLLILAIADSGPIWLVKSLLITGIVCTVLWFLGMAIFAAGAIRWDRKRRRESARNSAGAV